MNILHFGISENLGGIETYIKKIYDGIDQDCFHFDFIDMTGEDGHPALEEYFSKGGCAFCKVCPRRVSIKQNRKDLEKLFTDHHFDVLHFSTNTLSYIAPIPIALRHGCKVIVHSHSCNSASSAITKILHRINRWRLSLMHVERIAVSQPAGKWLFGSKKYQLFPNGVDTEMFCFSEEKRDAIRKSLHCEDKLVIAEVGAFLPVKNHLFTIDVFEQIKKKVANSVLWLIGQGETMEEVKAAVHRKQLDDSVFFLGKRMDMPELYSGMDAHILPSLFEGFSNVAVEAQSMGLPCLFADTVPEIAKVFDSFVFMPLSKSPTEWAGKLLQIIASSNIERENACHRMDEKGRSSKQEIQRVQRLYRDLLQ